jgi:Tfp pilus assembly protein PilF
MIEMDKVNPRIFRYLGYSAYENDNADLAIKSLESFIANPDNNVIAKDYLYLGTAKFKKGLSADGLSMEPYLYNLGLKDIKKAIKMEPLAAEDLNEIGKKMFTQKLYKEAASIFEMGVTNPEAKNYLDDNIYYGLSIYYANNKKDVKPDPIALQKSDTAFDKVIQASPSYSEAYLYRARTNSLLGNDEMTIKYYEIYIAKINEKGQEELAKPTTTKKIIESYNNIAASYANTDKTIAKEYLMKTLALDPTNDYATKSIKLLK